MMISAGQRWVEAGLDWWRLSLMAAETMAASQSVIAQRMAMMGRARPGRIPHVEMRRMGSEKVTAFSRGGADAARVLSKAFVDDGLIALALLERSIDASAAWWNPLHARATANAKRLGRVR